jgi:hypothetical protein
MKETDRTQMPISEPIEVNRNGDVIHTYTARPSVTAVHPAYRYAAEVVERLRQGALEGIGYTYVGHFSPKASIVALKHGFETDLKEQTQPETKVDNSLADIL